VKKAVQQKRFPGGIGIWPERFGCFIARKLLAAVDGHELDERLCQLAFPLLVADRDAVPQDPEFAEAEYSDERTRLRQRGPCHEAAAVVRLDVTASRLRCEG